MHCVHYYYSEKRNVLVIVQKQQQYVTGHASFWAVSSKTSDRLLKRPECPHRLTTYGRRAARRPYVVSR